MTQTLARKSLTAVLGLALIAMAAPQATSGAGTAQVVGSPARDCPAGELGVTANAFVVEQGPPPFREYRLVATGNSYDTANTATSESFTFALTKDEIAGTSRSLEFNSLCGEWDGCIFKLQMQQTPTSGHAWEDTESSWVSCLNVNAQNPRTCDLLGHCVRVSVVETSKANCDAFTHICDYTTHADGSAWCEFACLNGIGILSGGNADDCLFFTPTAVCYAEYDFATKGKQGDLCDSATMKGLFEGALFQVVTLPADSVNCS
jgi:hypothetical protein